MLSRLLVLRAEMQYTIPHQESFSSLPMQVGCGEHVVFNAIVVTGCDHDDVRAAEIGEQK
jgi:hypothetical protein